MQRHIYSALRAWARYVGEPLELDGEPIGYLIHHVEASSGSFNVHDDNKQDICILELDEVEVDDLPLGQRRLSNDSPEIMDKEEFSWF
jgi:hypothetical protein